MANELPAMLAGILKPPNSAHSSETVEMLRAATDTLITSETLAGITGIPEGRVGYARCGYSEVGAGTGDDLYTKSAYTTVTEPSRTTWASFRAYLMADADGTHLVDSSGQRLYVNYPGPFLITG